LSSGKAPVRIRGVIVKIQGIIMKRLSVAASILAIALSGCASPAMHENMVVSGEQLRVVVPGSKFHNKISKITVTGGSETIPIWTSQVSSESFQLALSESLNKAGLATEQGPYSLNANLVALDQPLLGVGMTVRASVDYKIKDEATGSVLFDETIDSAYTATMSDAVIGVKRLRLANEGAIRRNIEQFLKKINHS